ncbi:MAG: AraC family transcriptional regulator [Alphaproteobacteria bacterium]|nr:AraC family transcriptional regulator [Alphaproteobacteria bacterium]MBU0805415.1 AraC family transcriptional regulator [Alphaproteobacteria bacterium]MBU0873361.1 AraC family transcriptional regulator [Alphaproteobacteria bacterium]MBU1401411.1 AraC family transcriptional regulator [Alphaproteobacteria bacterium]MBU1592172.1 AraC family transcriptional regulator [Alphaproteobacteria bacterium]
MGADRNSSADVLSALAPLLRVRPELQYVCRFGAQWASVHAREPEAWAPFHIVTGGNCVLFLPETGRSLPMVAGDVAVLPHGSPHVVHAASTEPWDPGPFNISNRSTDGILVKTNDAEPEAKLVCGRLRFDHAGENLVLSALPDVIIIEAAAGGDARSIGGLISLLARELEAARPGAAAIAADIASALLVMAVRVHLEADLGSNTLLALLGHPQAGRAAAAMLEDPGRSWSLDELAGVSNSSRANLVRIFRRTANIAPLAFLSDLRLELARRKLSGSKRSLAGIAAEVGYQSESAFSRAFYLRYGMRPGEARRAST